MSDASRPSQPRPEHPSAAPREEPGPGRLRYAVEQRSLPALTRLARLPVWLPFLVLLATMLLGGFLGGVVGWVLVGLALAFILWLLYLSWPRLTTVERLMRGTVLLLFAVVTVTQLVPRT
ncbi:DUF6703 family protein [Ornithinimicrobium sp. W1679]|uniref:DUF6703 family protein n=1 Tax=Ornithinimicrobium sp. W1679 TaxID=3418770 RepID=UPI003CE7E09E